MGPHNVVDLRLYYPWGAICSSPRRQKLTLTHLNQSALHTRSADSDFEVVHNWPAKTTHEHIHHSIMEEPFRSPFKTSDEHSLRVRLPVYKTNSAWLMLSCIRKMFADLWSSKRWTCHIMNAIPITAFRCQSLCFERCAWVLQCRQYFN